MLYYRLFRLSPSLIINVPIILLNVQRVGPSVDWFRAIGRVRLGGVDRCAGGRGRWSGAAAGPHCREGVNQQYPTSNQSALNQPTSNQKIESSTEAPEPLSN